MTKSETLYIRFQLLLEALVKTKAFDLIEITKNGQNDIRIFDRDRLDDAMKEIKPEIDDIKICNSGEGNIKIVVHTFNEEEHNQRIEADYQNWINNGGPKHMNDMNNYDRNSMDFL